MTSSDIKSKVKSLLHDFTQSSRSSLDKGVSCTYSLTGNYEMWRLARFLFDEILAIKVEDQPFEKVNWYIHFVYQSKYSCSISHRKFGFIIHVYNGDSEEESKKNS